MIANKSVLAVIPARGGSKGIPKKNIKNLAGKPLIAWSILNAIDSKYIDNCIVSTDSKEIADIAESYGCNVPFLRPKELSLDESPSYPFMEHAINFYKEKNIEYDYFILLEPTSPLRETKDIDEALEILVKKKEIADSIVGVSKVEATHPVFDVKINSEGLIEPFMDSEFKIYRRQDIEPLYFKEGSIYISKVKILLKEKTFYHKRTLPFIFPRWKSIEIDEMIDFIYAEAVLQNPSLVS